MVKCSIVNCTNLGQHKFPKDVELRKKWETAIRCGNFKASDNSKLCSNHFKKEDYTEVECFSKDLKHQQKIKILKNGAIPSIVPLNKESTTGTNTREQIMPISELLEFGSCRFCGTKGEHRNMMVEHTLEGERVNYSNMLLDCFNIFISTDSVGSLICSTCVSRLRDANCFRLLVVRAEQHLIRGLTEFQVEDKVHIRSESKKSQPDAKTGPVEVNKEPAIDIFDHGIIHLTANHVPDVGTEPKSDSDPDATTESVEVKKELDIDIVEHGVKSVNELPDEINAEPRPDVRTESVEVKTEPEIDIVEHGVTQPPDSNSQRLVKCISNGLDALLEELKSKNDKDDKESYFNTDRNNTYGCSSETVEKFLEDFYKGQDDIEEDTEDIQFRCDVEMPVDGSGRFGIDLEEENAFLATGCDCQQKCVDKFNKNQVMKTRLDCLNLDFYCEHHINHLNLMILGALSAIANTGPETAHSELRQRNHVEFLYGGVPVCKQFFLFAHGLGTKKFRNVLKSFQDNGVEARMHNRVKMPYLPIEQTADMVSFINNFSAQNSLVLPGRSQVKNMELHILPSSVSRTYVYEKYVKACKQFKKQPVSPALWHRCWDNFCPNVVTRNLTDPCNTCKNFASVFARAKSEDTKARILRDALDHFNFVKEQRDYYQNSISLAPVMVDMSLGPHAPCSCEALMHYSFDYLQQVSLPHNPDNAGPLQFLSGYKVSLFGVAVEPLQKFVLYVIPESCISKGPNLVVSLLHHFFENFALGETHVVCHAGNSANLNKNNVMIQYAIWRVMSKLHKSFQLSFLPDGHSKFAPDVYFGLFKSKFRKSHANSLMDVCQIAVSADKLKSTIGVIVGNETGDIIHINTYDWTKYFNDNSPTPIPELPTWLHFKTETRNRGRGSVMCSTTPNDYTNIVPVFDVPFVQNMPMIIPLQGLSFERQKYLYENIRTFVPPEFCDSLCPIPKGDYIFALHPIIEKEYSIDSSDPPKPEIDPLDTLDLLDTKDEKDYKREEVELVATPIGGNNRRNSPICSYCGLVGHRNQIRHGKYFCRKRQLDNEASTSVHSNVKKKR